MNMRALVLIGTGVGVGVVGAATLMNTNALAAPGTLDPPAGPVEGTGRTLDEIYDRIEATELQVATIAANGGPWQSFTQFVGANDQLTAIRVGSGRVHVHAVIANAGRVTLFDGPGTVDSSARPLTGHPIGALRQITGGNGLSLSSTTVELDVVAENGLFVAWNGFNSFADLTFTVLYRELD